MAAKKSNTYQSALDELHGLVEELQEEAVSVDDLSAKVKRAAELVQFCRQRLRQSEEEVNELFAEE